MANEEWNPTPLEKKQEIVVWLEFLARALAAPTIEEGVVYFTTSGTEPRIGRPENPGQGCGTREGLTDVGMTLPETVEILTELHDLADSLPVESS